MLNKVALLKCSWVGLAALLLGAGCQAQVGEDYRGEVLLSLKGSVVIEDAAAADLVPVLTFPSPEGWAIIDAHVEGQYPSRFRMEVTEPPPASSLIARLERVVDGVLVPVGPAYAQGFITLAPRQHPRFVKDAGGAGDGMCNDDESVCQYDVKECISPDLCRQIEISCTSVKCPVIAETGEPIPASQAATITGIGESFGDESLSLLARCNSAGECHRVYSKCALPLEPGIGKLRLGVDTTCQMTSPTVDDPRFGAAKALRRAAIGYTVRYLAEPTELPPYGVLAAGYHVFRQLEAESDEAWMANLACQLDGQEPATCPVGLREEVVSSDEELTLRLGARPQSTP